MTHCQKIWSFVVKDTNTKSVFSNYRAQFTVWLQEGLIDSNRRQTERLCALQKVSKSMIKEDLATFQLCGAGETGQMTK